MKTLLKIVGALVVLAGLGLGAVVWLTSDMVDSVDQFFADVQEGEVDSAYTTLSKQFQKSTSLPQLKQFLQASSLSDFESASWTSRSVKNGVGELEGSIQLKSGSSVPLKVQLVKESGAWKIFSLQSPRPGIQGQKQALSEADAQTAIPETAALISLVQNTSKIFGQSMNSRNFEAFYNILAKPWKDQSSPEILQENFKGLFGVEANWEALANLSPVFESEPQIGEDGVLQIQGRLDTQPDQLVFRHSYALEGGAWKPIGLHLQFRQQQAEEAEEQSQKAR